MFQQPVDFKDESDALYALLKDRTDEELGAPTQFKAWTIDNVIRHLHVWNCAADMSLRDEEEFGRFMKSVGEQSAKTSSRHFEELFCDSASGQKLLTLWHDFYGEMADHFLPADPKMRVKWAGPDMSVRSSITARLMETWAHGQEVFDTLGVARLDEDRVKNIAVLGVNTFGWTHIVHKEEVPAEVPSLRLTAPSGEIWDWNDPVRDNHIEGLAAEFCQVVTQTRNIADTGLKVTGKTAIHWMEIAQCFAGGPETPPAPGARHVVAAHQ